MCAAPAALLALAVLLPFLNKAHRGDDVTFLLQAKHVLVDPLHPTAFDIVVQGVRVRLSHVLVSGPAMAYLLVPCVLLGGAEWVAHAIQAFFIVITAVATAGLALRLGLDRQQATVASLLIVVSPAALGMAATAMPDVPAMAFAASGMERIVAWNQSRRWSAAVAAAILLALAVLSRSHVLLLFGCAGSWLIAEQRRRSQAARWAIEPIVESLVPLLLGLMLVLLVIRATRDPASGYTIATATLGRLEPQLIASNLASFAAQWVVAFPLGVLWPVLRGKQFLNVRRTYAAFALSAVLVLAGWGYSIPGFWWTLAFLLLAGHGLDVLADILDDAWKRRDRTQMLLGTWLLIAVVTAPYVHLPPKVLLPSAPAMAILLASRVRLSAEPRVRTQLIGLVGLAGVLLGLLVLRADNTLSEIGREGGRVVARQARAGRTVWIDGAADFDWYALVAGAQRVATTGPRPKPGDVIVAGLYPSLAHKIYPRKTLLYRQVFAEPGGRVQGNGAGFFSNHFGPLPWVWGREEFGRIEVWRVDSP